MVSLDFDVIVLAKFLDGLHIVARLQLLLEYLLEAVNVIDFLCLAHRIFTGCQLLRSCYLSGILRGRARGERNSDSGSLQPSRPALAAFGSQLLFGNHFADGRVAVHVFFLLLLVLFQLAIQGFEIHDVG